MTNGTLSPALTLSNDDLRRVAPSIFATHPYHDVSDRYRFLPTIHVLDILRDRGFHPVKATQSTTRLADKREFTRHMVRLRHADHLNPCPSAANCPSWS